MTEEIRVELDRMRRHCMRAGFPPSTLTFHGFPVSEFGRADVEIMLAHANLNKSRLAMAHSQSVQRGKDDG